MKSEEYHKKVSELKFEDQMVFYHRRLEHKVSLNFGGIVGFIIILCAAVLIVLSQEPVELIGSVFLYFFGGFILFKTLKAYGKNMKELNKKYFELTPKKKK